MTQSDPDNGGGWARAQRGPTRRRFLDVRWAAWTRHTVIASRRRIVIGALVVLVAGLALWGWRPGTAADASAGLPQHSATGVPGQAPSAPTSASPVAPRPITPRCLTLQVQGRTVAERVPVKAMSSVLAPMPEQGKREVLQFGIPHGDYVADGTTYPEQSYVSWWQDGYQPGADGVAIMLGHTWNRGVAVFNELPSVGIGDHAQVCGVDAAGAPATLDFTAISVVNGIPKRDENALRDVLDQAPAGARLALVTCSGGVTASGHTDNTVAFYALEPPAVHQPPRNARVARNEPDA